MCGIAGIHRFGKAPIDPDAIEPLLLAIEHRGMDATGIALMNGKELHVLKNDVPAWKFVAEKGFTAFLNEFFDENLTDTVLLHTRAATKASPKVLKNNHPIHAKKGAIIHNGVVWRDDELFNTTYREQRHAETDSDIFRAMVDRYGLTPRTIKEFIAVGGSAAVAAVHPDFPGKLLLCRSGNPILLHTTAYDPQNGMLVWASTREAIYKGLRPWKNHFGVWAQKTHLEGFDASMADHTAYIFGPQAMEFRGEMKIAQSFTPAKYNYNTPGNYNNRRARWKDEKHIATTGDASSSESEDHTSTRPITRPSPTTLRNLLPSAPVEATSTAPTVVVETPEPIGKTPVSNALLEGLSWRSSPNPEFLFCPMPDCRQLIRLTGRATFFPHEALICPKCNHKLSDRGPSSR